MPYQEVGNISTLFLPPKHGVPWTLPFRLDGKWYLFILHRHLVTKLITWKNSSFGFILYIPIFFFSWYAYPRLPLWFFTVARYWGEIAGKGKPVRLFRKRNWKIHFGTFQALHPNLHWLAWLKGICIESNLLGNSLFEFRTLFCSLISAAKSKE